MSTLPEIAEAMCKRVAVRDIDGCRSLALQMAAKMGAPRGPRITRAFENWQARPVGNLKHWFAVAEPRSPWTPDAVISRFQIVTFPAWDDLEESSRLEFASSHGHAPASEGAMSYADVVQAARRHRVNSILECARTGKPLPTSTGETAELFSEAQAQ